MSQNQARTARKKSPQPEPLVVTVPVAAQMLGIGMTKMWALIREGAVDSVLLGKQTRRVPVAALHAYVASLSAVPAGTQ